MIPTPYYSAMRYPINVCNFASKLPMCSIYMNELPGITSNRTCLGDLERMKLRILSPAPELLSQRDEHGQSDNGEADGKSHEQ